MALRHFDILHHYTASQPRRFRHEAFSLDLSIHLVTTSLYLED